MEHFDVREMKGEIRGMQWRNELWLGHDAVKLLRWIRLPRRHDCVTRSGALGDDHPTRRIQPLCSFHAITLIGLKVRDAHSDAVTQFHHLQSRVLRSEVYPLVPYSAERSEGGVDHKIMFPRFTHRAGEDE